MTTSDRYFRLRIDPSGADGGLLVLTSVPGGTHPYIAEPPRGDGEEIDVVTGEVRHGAYTVLAMDPETGADADLITEQIADAGGQYQLLGLPARIEVSSNGTSWTVQTAGYVQSVRFVDAASAEFTVGDAQRIDLTREVFAAIAHWDTDTAAWVEHAFDAASSLIGGPVRGSWGVRVNGEAFLRDRGAWRMEVETASGTTVGLKFLRGWVMTDTGYAFKTGGVGVPARLNKLASQYVVPRGSSWWYPGLLARLDPVAGGSDILTNPQSRNLVVIDDESGREGDPSPVLVANGITVDWSGSLPSVGTLYDVYVTPLEISERNPLHIFAHPVDIATDLWDEAGIVWDSTAATSTRNAIGPNVRLLLRVTQSYVLADFTKLLFGAFGLGWRTGTDGERELFTTRKRNASAPGTTVALTDLLGSGDDQPVIFDLDEATIIDVVTVSERRFVLWTPEFVDEERPADDVLSFKETKRIEWKGSDATHEATFEVPGTIQTAFSIFGRTIVLNADFQAFVEGIAKDILPRFGFGCPAVELEVREEVAPLLGEEFILDVAHQVNGNARGGQRILQVVRRTPQPDGGVSLKCLDAGQNAQLATAPTLSIAAVGRVAATITITNAGSLATGSTVRIEWGVGASQPTDGDLLTSLDPAVADEMQTPRVDTGSRIWARARTEHQDQRPSAWSSWVNVDLTDLAAPTALTNTGNVLSWTVGETDYPLALDVTVSGRTDRLRVLPKGTTSFDPTPFVPASTSVTFDLYHVDESPFGGASAADTHTFTTAAGVTLTAPVAPVGFVGRRNGAYTGEAGIEVTQIADFPCEIEFDMAVEDSPGAGTYGSFSTMDRIRAVVGAPTRYTTFAPKDGKKRRFRARAVRDGATASSYTSNVDVLAWGSFTPAPIPRRNLPIVLDSGVADGYPAKASALDGDLDANIDGDTEVQGGSLFLEDDESLPIGTIATPSSIEKPIRIPAAAFVPKDDSTQYQFVANQIRPSALNVFAEMWAPVVIPDGVTIVGWYARLNEGTGGAVTLVLRRITDESTAVDIGSLAGTSSGWETVSEVLSEDTTGRMYTIVAQLTVTSPPGSLTSQAGLLEAGIDYDVPDHTKTL